MRHFVLLALLIAFIPAAVWANDCGSCNKCKPACKQECAPKCGKCESKCESKCNVCKPKCVETCKPKCMNTCKPKCETACKPKCENKCDSCNMCKPKCENKCGKCESKCDMGCGKCKPKCDRGCNKCASKCDSCAAAPACPKPCACDAWMPYCGCEMVKSLCISINACEGTAGPLKLLIRNPLYKELVTIELPGPIDGYYDYTYTFDAPVKATDLIEAVLINDGDDPATITSFRVVGMDEACFSYVYVDHTCPGAVIGPGGCPRMVIY